MVAPIVQSVPVLPARAGWSAVVESMEAAFSDPTHIIVLGIVFGSLVVLYANYRVARWIERKGEHRHGSR